ncbi:MAG: hypothetical protein WCJ01_06550 [Ignavibacteria bacterium]
MKICIYTIIIFCFFSAVIFPQNKWERNKFDKTHQKIEELEKIKLVDALDLNEENMVKLLGRRRDFNQKLMELNRQKDERLDQIQKLFEGDKSDKNEQFYKKQIEELVLTEKETAKLKAEFLNSLKDIMTYRQISRFIVFERNFRKELRELILKERKNKVQ